MHEIAYKIILQHIYNTSLVHVATMLRLEVGLLLDNYEI